MEIGKQERRKNLTLNFERFRAQPNREASGSFFPGATCNAYLVPHWTRLDCLHAHFLEYFATGKPVQKVRAHKLDGSQDFDVESTLTLICAFYRLREWVQFLGCSW